MGEGGKSDSSETPFSLESWSGNEIHLEGEQRDGTGVFRTGTYYGPWGEKKKRKSIGNNFEKSQMDKKKYPRTQNTKGGKKKKKKKKFFGQDGGKAQMNRLKDAPEQTHEITQEKKVPFWSGLLRLGRGNSIAPGTGTCQQMGKIEKNQVTAQGAREPLFGKNGFRKMGRMKEKGPRGESSVVYQNQKYIYNVGGVLSEKHPSTSLYRQAGGREIETRTMGGLWVP